MPRYIKATGRRSRGSQHALQDKLLRNLEHEGRRILKQLTSEATNEFLKSLQIEGDRLLQTSLSQSGGGFGANPLNLVGESGFGKIVGSLINSIIFRPKTTTRTKETARSKETNQLFRLSRRQSLAEAGVEIGKGEKNL